MSQKTNPFQHLISELIVNNKSYKYFSIQKLGDPRIENVIRNCDQFNIKQEDVEKILDWKIQSTKDIECPFKPSRVLLQDFTGVPCVVDLAAMRDAIIQLGSDPQKINPQVPVDLVIDHSVQVDFAKQQNSQEKNEEIEFERNFERFEFLKWGSKSFSNFRIIPPGSGIVHQVNLEFLARVVFEHNGLIYPDTCIGTDSHTTMINGLGVVGWGVGGIEAESVMMGEHITMVLPEVVGFELTGNLPENSTATDLVLTCVQMLRQRKVVGKFVEFFGSGCLNLSLADRATISNMAPEYGATIGYFPIDKNTLEYLKTTGRSQQQVQMVENYLKAQGLFRLYDGSQKDPYFSGEVLKLNLSTVIPCVSGPKRPQDKVPLNQMKVNWAKNLIEKVSFNSFGIDKEKVNQIGQFSYQGKQYSIKHGSIVIAAITSCTNTSNPDVILGAGLLAKNAVQKGLNVAPYIKTSLSPGSLVVKSYLENSGLQNYFDQLGFNIAGFGCMTCIGNSGPLDDQIVQTITQNDLVVCSVLSGNRNFEGRVHPNTRANWLCSPILVVAYALAGTIEIDFDNDPLGKDQQGNPIFLKDIWPLRSQIQQAVHQLLNPEMFNKNYSQIEKGTKRWNDMKVTESKLYQWKEVSTYIHNPPFFQNISQQLPEINDIKDAYVLGYFQDSITTDHISPAGNIGVKSPAGQFLQSKNIMPADFNSYGSRRGNDLIMSRGTFANTRIINLLLKGEVGPYTIHIPSNQKMTFFEASQKYQQTGNPCIIIAGNEYGSGSSRDWAAKGPQLLGVKVVIAQSFERIHRSNLIGMGILPLEFNQGESAQSLGISGTESFNIKLNNGKLQVNQQLEIFTNDGKSFKAKVRLDTDSEILYFKNGGILQFVLRKLSNSK